MTQASRGDQPWLASWAVGVRGSRPVRWFHAMVRDLTTVLPEVPAPPGVQITAFTPERSDDARLIRNEAFTVDHTSVTHAKPLLP